MLAGSPCGSDGVRRTPVRNFAWRGSPWPAVVAALVALAGGIQAFRVARRPPASCTTGRPGAASAARRGEFALGQGRRGDPLRRGRVTSSRQGARSSGCTSSPWRRAGRPAAAWLRGVGDRAASGVLPPGARPPASPRGARSPGGVGGGHADHRDLVPGGPRRRARGGDTAGWAVRPGRRPCGDLDRGDRGSTPLAASRHEKTAAGREDG